MGPTLARMAKRASDAAGMRRRVIGASRFSDASQIPQLNAHGIETICCDLMDDAAVAQLPDVENVVYCAGMKFGATGKESLTWAMNTWLPSVVCRKFRRSRIAAFSTGNIYGLAPVSGGGSVETDSPRPVGEYAMSCLGRERMFEHFSRTLGIPTVIVRLNYACELRYGVLVDIARKVWTGQPVDLGMGWFNCLWQGDANALTLQSLALAATPPLALNLTGPELLGVRAVAEKLAHRMNRPVDFTGTEGNAALLSNSAQCFERLGAPRFRRGTAGLGGRLGDERRPGPRQADALRKPRRKVLNRIPKLSRERAQRAQSKAAGRKTLRLETIPTPIISSSVPLCSFAAQLRSSG